MDQVKARRFDGVSYEAAMASAAELVPVLKAHAGQTEAERRIAPTVMDALHASGLMRAFQPKSWGGMELDFAAWSDIPEMLARGCCSTAWNVANLASHHRTLAQMSEAAQHEVWESDPDALIASGNAYQQGRATRVGDDFRLTGKWNFCSAVPGAGWNILAAILYEDDKPADWLACLMRADEYTVIDDWQTMGMRGTGSCTVEVADVLVPAHRVQSMAIARPGHEFAGVRVNRNPVYRISTPAIGGHGLGACAVGGAQGALDAMIEWVKSRSTSFTAAKMRDFQTVQLRTGLAGAKIDAARLILRNDCIEAERTLKEGRTATTEEKLRYKRNAAAAVRLAVEAVDILFEMAGANGIYDTSPLQRYFRDVKSASAHIHFVSDMHMSAWGNVMLGGEFKSPTM